MKFSTLYDHHDGPEISDFGPSLTKQEFAQEADINYIMEQFHATGMAPMVNPATIYGDFTDPALNDYQLQLERLRSAQELFDQLPPKIRERFQNEPAQLIMFAQDPANQAEARELGLLRPEATAAPPAAPPEPPATPPKP